MMKKIKIIFLNKNFLLGVNVFFIILIMILIFWVINLKDNENGNREIIRDKNINYKFTNPILDCENLEQDKESILSHDDVLFKVEYLKETYGLENISLYFRDLNNGPWIGVEEKEVFSPASLLKAPILISLFKYAESNPEIFKKEIEVKDSDVESNYTPSIVATGVLEKGNKYTIEQIAESMIKKSDNTGAGILIKNIPEKYISDVFYSVGVPYKDTHDEVDVRVKDYAGFFRVLFNASYLNREMSEKALEMMSQTEYKYGLVAGVPSNILVSHKFGERTFEDVRQLHDCGIVYYPDKPYVLCIMTKGNNFIEQQEVIKELSSFIYKKVDSEK